MSNETLSPINAAAKPPVANPISPAGGERVSTLKLKPVIRKPGVGTAPAPLNVPVKPVIRATAEPATVSTAAAAPAAPKALDQLKSVTQRLKDVTQEIPQQAILRKTGIIAEQQALTEAQKQASKARTARISLSDAIGVAPVKNESAPMKTIRIKRPLDLPAAGAKPPTAAAAPAPAPAPAAEEPKAEAEPTMTQRKTLKIARPGAGAARPAPKFGVKKPGAATPATPAPAAQDAGEVADIPDIPDMPTAATASFAPVAPAPAGEKDVPVVIGALSLIVQVAACIVMGALGYFLYTAANTPMY